MTERPGGALGTARSILLAGIAIAVVGLLARSPATVPRPVGPGRVIAKSTPTAAPDQAVSPSVDIDAYREVARLGTWSTVGVPVPLNGLNPGPSVWNSRELFVGFTPDVAAYDPAATGRLTQRWRALAPHPDGALEVRGAVRGAGAAVVVYGHRSCSGCAWQPSLWTLDPASDRWRQLPDAPGVMADLEQVVATTDGVVVARDHGDEGLQVLAFDTPTSGWADLAFPATPGLTAWQLVGMGSDLLVLGVVRMADGGVASHAVRWDGQTADWHELTAGVPLAEPHRATAVWTGDQVVFLGSVLAGPAVGPRRQIGGASLNPLTGDWTELPPLPADNVGLPDLSRVRTLDGIVGEWDGERAAFVGGLSTPLFLAWSPTEDAWQVRQSTRPRAGGRLWWSGRQLLLWGGVDRNGPIQDLQVWPAQRPVE